MLSKKLQNIRTEFLVFIQLRKKSNPVNSPEIERRFTLSGSEVREMVEQLRNEGYPIANTLIDGEKKIKVYFYAETWDDMKPTIEDLEGRALSMLKTTSSIRKKFNQFDSPTLF